jgi:hypothetical protein
MPKFIEQRRNGFYAVVEVPPSLRAAVGRKRLRKTLSTSDMATAKLRVWGVVADLKAQIDAARQTTTGDAVKDEARALRATLLAAKASKEEEHLRGFIEDRAREILGGPTQETRDGAPWEFEYDPDREKRAADFHQLATGQATPLEEYLELWLSESHFAERTKGDHRRAIKLLKDWPDGHIETLEAVTRKKAGEFVSWLLRPRGETWTGDAKTAAKYKSSLSSYWRFLKGKREGVTRYGQCRFRQIRLGAGDADRECASRVHAEVSEREPQGFLNPQARHRHKVNIVGDKPPERGQRFLSVRNRLEGRRVIGRNCPQARRQFGAHVGGEPPFAGSRGARAAPPHVNADGGKTIEALLDRRGRTWPPLALTACGGARQPNPHGGFEHRL